jgi:transposase
MLQVCNAAISVFKTDMEDLKDLGKRKYLINPDYKDLSRADKFKELGKARRKTRDNNILPYYDCNKSVKDNAKELEVSKNTIRNCLNDNNIKTTNQEKFDRFIVIYGNCPDASVRQLIKLTELSDKTVQKYKKKYDDLILSVEYDIKPIYNFQHCN